MATSNNTDELKSNLVRRFGECIATTSTISRISRPRCCTACLQKKQLAANNTNITATKYLILAEKHTNRVQ